MRYELPISTEVKTLYTPFCKPSAAKPPRVLFVNSVQAGREVAELVQLTDMEYANVTFDKAWDLNKWGFGDCYDKRGDQGDQRIMDENLEEALLSDACYDCIVLPAINGWNLLTVKARGAIYDRVAAGAGLLLIQPVGEAEADGVRLADISPLVPAERQKPYTDEWYNTLRTDTWIPAPHAITRGIPFGSIPYDRLAYVPYTLGEGAEVVVRAENGDPVAAVRTVGKGRVAAFAYFNRDFMPQHEDFRGRDGCFNPITDTWRGGMLPADAWNFMEAFYRLTARAIAWCGRQESVGTITAAVPEDGGLRVSHTGAGDVTAVLFDRYGRFVANADCVGGFVKLPALAIQTGGDIRAELTLADGGRVCDYYTAVIPQTARATLTLAYDGEAPVLENGGMLTVHVTLTGAADSVELGLVDDYGRVLATRVPDTAADTSVTFGIDDILAAHVCVTAAATENGVVTARARSQACVVTPKTRKLDDFQVFLNPQNRGQGDLLPYVNRLFPAIGMTGNFIGDNRVTAMSGAHGFGVYWYNRKKYTEQKERWLETNDKTHLHRKPCLNNDEFWAENHTAVLKNVARQKKYGPIAYFAQDEGSLTCYSDELDFCFCPDCMKGLQAWLKEQYGTLDALNVSWKTAYTDWAQAEPLTREEARLAGVWTSWADHRSFMEITYTNAYKNMRSYIKEVDENGEVRMSGCQASTAYTGNDYDLLHQYVRYFEAYPVGGQYEFHRSFKQPDTILGGWFGYGSQGVSARNSVWNAVFHGLTLCSIFWEYAILNHDFTYSQSARDFGAVFAEIKQSGIGKLLLYAAQQDTLGVALHYSMASVHAANIADKKTFFEKNRDAWSGLLEDVGAQYRYVSTRQIEAGALASGVKFLILPCSMAITDKEAAAIEAFVQAGGIVLGDVQTGLLDGHCGRRDAAALDHIFGIKRLRTQMETHSQDGEFVPNADFKFFDISAISEEAGPGIPKPEPGIRVTTGIRAFRDTFSSHNSAVVVNPCGKGFGVYLNLAPASYAEFKTDQAAGAGTRTLLTEILRFAGVSGIARVSANGEALSGIERFYYTIGAGKVYGLKRGIGSQKVNWDGLILDNKESDGNVQRCLVDFPAEGHIYNLRENKYVGFGSQAECGLAEGDAVLFAVLPYRASGLTLTQETENSFRIALDAPGVEKTVFAVRVTKPDGTYCALYSKNIAVEGSEAVFTIPFAQSDAGIWQIDVTDTMTGVSAALAVARAEGKTVLAEPSPLP